MAQHPTMSNWGAAVKLPGATVRGHLEQACEERRRLGLFEAGLGVGMQVLPRSDHLVEQRLVGVLRPVHVEPPSDDRLRAQ